MPPPIIRGIVWAFIKEAFFNKKTILGFAQRNKLAALLAFTNTILFFTLLFMSEQAFQHQARALGLKQQLAQLTLVNQQLTTTDKDFRNCRDQMDFLQEDYRKVSHSLSMCIAKTPQVVAGGDRGPKPRETPRNPPVIPTRSFTDDSLKRKLDAIRD